MTVPAGAGTAAGQFLDTSHGRIFCMASLAGAPTCVVIAAPFAEEMNKCRRMWSLLRQELTTAGIGLLIADLYGTGESDGDFADARWPLWCEDLERACHEARERGSQRIVLLGVRLGALLALDVARTGRLAIGQLVFWQPVLHGQQHMTQFLRLKLAAGLRQAAATKETTASLRERLARGERLEVAGYELAGELVSAIDALDGTGLASQVGVPIHWLEVSSQDPAALLPASERTLAKWRDSGVDVRGQCVRGEAFWALQEITVAPELNRLTLSVLGGAHA